MSKGDAMDAEEVEGAVDVQGVVMTVATRLGVLWDY